MKCRKWIIAALALTLCGCAQAETDLNRALNTKLAQREAEPVPAPYYHKDFYGYYTEPCVGRISASETGNIFKYENCFIIMNLDVPAILRAEGSEQVSVSFSGGNEKASVQGTYLDRSEQEHAYSVRISALGDSYYVFLQSDTMQFYAVCPQYTAASAAAQMLKIARSVEVNIPAVVARYQSSNGIEYAGETIELFDSITPENGSIEELFPDPVVPGDFSQNTENSKENTKESTENTKENAENAKENAENAKESTENAKESTENAKESTESKENTKGENN